jgi:predicted AlkP superfamily phosphohydrolase/phosphomutase
MSIWKRSLLGAEVFVVLSLILLCTLNLNNPFFADSAKGVVIYFILVPAFLGFLYGIVISPIVDRVLAGAFPRKGGPVSEVAARFVFNIILLFLFSLLLFFTLLVWEMAVLVKVLVLILGAAILWLAKRVLQPLVVSIPLGATRRLTRLSIYALLVFLLFGGSALRRAVIDHQRESKAAGRNQVLMYGIDGAVWSVIKPMMAEGELPNLKALMESGVSADLESLTPTFSPQVWGTIASGKVPSKHGITDFLTTTDEVRAKRLWDIFSDNGSTVGVFGYLNTYPPYPVRGFIFPSYESAISETYPKKYSFYCKLHTDLFELPRKREAMGAVPQKKLTAPHKLVSPVLQCLRYGMRLSTFDYCLRALLLKLSPNDKFKLDVLRVHSIQAKQRIFSDIFAYLTAREMPDLAIFYGKVPHSASHRYWKYAEPQKFERVDPVGIKKLGEVIREGYREDDIVLGKFLRNRTPGQTIMICSDHGMQAALSKAFSLRGQKLLETLDIHEGARIWNVDDAAYLVIDDPAYAEATFRLLGQVTVKETGEPLLDIKEITQRLSWTRPESTQQGSNCYRLNVNPSLQEHIDPNLRLNVGGQSFPCSEYLMQTSRIISGIHSDQGILIVNGENFKQGYKLSSASVKDITPTTLALCGLPLGRDMDGEVLQDAFREDFFAHRTIKYIDSHDDRSWSQRAARAKRIDVDVEAELKALGYLR